MPVPSAPRHPADDDDEDADDEYGTRLLELSMVVVDSGLARFDWRTRLPSFAESD
jgi:hypothetical protein